MNEALWALGRGTGVVALLCFTASLCLGVAARSGRDLLGLGRTGVAELHRTAALTGTALVALHVGTLLLDSEAQLRVVDAVLPFLGTYRPLWQGLGTLAVDLLLVVTVVSLLRDRVGPRVFRVVHGATYVLWPVSLAHAVGNGTDGTSAWFVGLAVACAAAVAVALGWRVSTSYAERGRRRVPRTARPTGAPTGPGR